MKQEDFFSYKNRLDSISPTCCLAKWTQVTLHLQLGTNHSCHHPKTHEIPIEEILQNPSALHNTSYKARQRELMKTGERPKECDYCWNIEDSDKPYLSDRYAKSASSWSTIDFEKIKESPASKHINPRYLEVSFSNGCNFKCSYCSPMYSSSWAKELKTHGSYLNHSEKFNNLEQFETSGSKPIPYDQENPYVDAFWKWWPDLIEDLKVFRITGGEPFMSPETFKVFEKIISGPKRDLSLAVNSNLGIKDALFEKALNYIKELTESDKVTDFTLYTSAEAWGDKAEYIRSGLNFELFWSRLHRLMSEVPKCRVVFMCTYNALSVSSFTQFLKGALELKKEYSNQFRGGSAPHIDIPYLRHPRHQSIGILTADYLHYLEESLNFMRINQIDTEDYDPGFYTFETQRMERVIEWFKKPIPDEQLLRERSDFYQFFSQHDQRRGTDFLSTFPEMEGFWNLCKKSSESFLGTQRGLA